MNIKKILLSTYVICIIGLLTGCVPTFNPEKYGAPTTRIDLTKMQNPQLCIDKERYLLNKEKNGFSSIPAGRKLVLSNHFSSSDYFYEYSCSPSISFIPQKNQKYYADFQIEENKCNLTILREDSSNEAGLSKNPTIGDGEDC